MVDIPVGSGSWWRRGEVALESPGARVPCCCRYGRRSRARLFVRCSKDLLLLEIPILAPWGVYVDDTQSDVRRNLTVKMYSRTGQPCQGRGTADDPRSWLTGSFIPGSPCMRVPTSTIHVIRTTLSFTLHHTITSISNYFKKSSCTRPFEYPILINIVTGTYELLD